MDCKKELDPTYIGIDVSKKTLDVFITSPSQAMQVKNDSFGISDMINHLKTTSNPIVILESTGGYERDAARTLTHAGIAVVVINPKQARDFAKASGRLAKTDRIDAQLLAQFGLAMKLHPRPLCDEDHQTLRDLVRRRFQLIEMRTEESNRLEHTIHTSVKASITQTINFIYEQILQIERQMDDIVGNSTSLSEDVLILTSIPGIGSISAFNLISELPELGHCNRRQIAMLVGVAPINRDSGMMRGMRMIGGGRKEIRCALWMATISAMTCNPVIKAFAHRLRENAKKGKVIIIACLRKLITIMNTMMARRETWANVNLATT